MYTASRYTSYTLHTIRTHFFISIYDVFVKYIIYIHKYIHVKAYVCTRIHVCVCVYVSLSLERFRRTFTVFDLTL